MRLLVNKLEGFREFGWAYERQGYSEVVLTSTPKTRRGFEEFYQKGKRASSLSIAIAISRIKICSGESLADYAFRGNVTSQDGRVLKQFNGLATGLLYNVALISTLLTGMSLVEEDRKIYRENLRSKEELDLIKEPKFSSVFPEKSKKVVEKLDKPRKKSVNLRHLTTDRGRWRRLCRKIDF